MNDGDSTVDRSSSSLSADHEDSLDRYRNLLGVQAVTPRQWIREHPHLDKTPAYLQSLWDQYCIKYPPPFLPGFEILDVLGEGGMGRVYLARDLSLGREVAIKELTGGGQHIVDPERFRLEAKILARLEHPNIVKIHRFIRHEGREFIEMDNQPGGSLADRMGRTMPDLHTSFPRMLAKIARAIDHAHGENVIHRDLKPSNILFGKDGEPRVSDFGLAKDLDDSADRSRGAVLGTHHYMAPEQVEGKTPVPGTDLWAIGVILYRVLAGRFPFDGASASEIHAEIRTERPAEMPTHVSAELRRICGKCLEKNPSDRYQRGNDLAADLDRAAGKRPFNYRWIAIVAAALALLGGGALAVPTAFRMTRAVGAETPIAMREKLPDESRSIAISPDGGSAFSEITGNRFAVWDARKAQLAAPIQDGGLGAAIRNVPGAIAASGNRKVILITPNVVQRLAHLELIDADTFQRTPVKFVGRLFGRVVTISPDNKRIALVTYRQEGIVDLAFGTGKPRLSVYDLDRDGWVGEHDLPGEITCMAFSPDGKRIATGSREPLVHVWDWMAKAPDRQFAVPEGGVDGIAISDDGARFFVGSIANSSLSIFSAVGQPAKPLSTTAATGAKITCVALNPRGEAITGHRDGTVVTWNLQTGKHRRFVHSGSEAVAVAIATNGSRAVASFADGTVVAVDLPQP
jgi:hypothetical protein